MYLEKFAQKIADNIELKCINILFGKYTFALCVSVVGSVHKNLVLLVWSFPILGIKLSVP